MLLHIEVSRPQAVTVPLINYCMLLDALTMERCVFLNMPAQTKWKSACAATATLNIRPVLQEKIKVK